MKTPAQSRRGRGPHRLAAALAVAAGLLAATPAGADVVPPLTPHESLFARQAMAPTLALCHLPARCDGLRPRHVERKPPFSSANSGTLAERVVTYDGLELHLFYNVDDGSIPATDRQFVSFDKPTVVDVVITSARWPAAFGVRVGMRGEEVARRLGGARTTGDDGCARYVDEQTFNEATICYASDRVRSIRWVAWWD